MPRILSFLLGILFWMLAVITDSLGYLFEIESSAAFAGVFILIGFGYFMLTVFGEKDERSKYTEDKP